MADDDYSGFISEQGPSDNTGTGNIRVMSEWVPGEPRTHATQYGPDQNPLEFGVSAAVSPNLAAGHQLHEPFEVYHEGNLVGRYNYDDRSFYSPGNPTYNTVERYGLPDLGRGYSIKWLGQNTGDDYSGFTTEARPSNSDYSGFNSEHDYGGFNTEKPKDKSSAWNLGQSIKNIWDSALAQSAKMGLGAAQAETQQAPLGSDPYEQRIKEIQIDPMLSDSEKQKQTDEVKLLQEEHRAKVVPKAQEAYAAAEKQVQADKPGKITQLLGSAVPYVASGLVGLPAGMTGMSALVAAQQASSEMYADTLRDSVDKAKKADPSLSDAEVMKKAVKASTEASKASSGAMLGLSLLHLDVPSAWPIIGRIATKVGLGAATMEVANTLAEVQKNMAIKKDVDPKQDLLEGLRNVEFYLTNAVAGGGFGGLHGLGGEIGRPSHVPIEDRVPIAEVPDTKEKAPKVEEPTQPEKVVAAANRYSNGKVFTGTDHGDAASKAEKSEPLAKVDPKTGAPGEYPEEGFVTSTGRFVTRDEAHAISGARTAEALQQQEKPVFAASRYVDPEGKEHVTTGSNHWETAEPLMEKHGVKFEDVEAGFVTNKGRFVDRKEAWKLAQLEGTGVLHATDLIEGEGVNRYVKKVEETQSPVTATEPWLSAIANRYVEERQASGEIGPVTPGKGTTPEAVMAMGTAMRPEEVAQHVSDLMQGKGSVQQVAALRAEEARLSQNSWRLSRIAEANPNDPIAQRNAEDAHGYLMNFLNGPIKKLKENWAQTGHGLQKEIEVDLGSFNGLREQWFKDVGKEPSKDVQAKMRDTARKVREAQAAEQNAMKTLSDEIEKQTARRRLPTEDQVRNNILARMNGDNPCGL